MSKVLVVFNVEIADEFKQSGFRIFKDKNDFYRELKKSWIAAVTYFDGKASDEELNALLKEHENDDACFCYGNTYQSVEKYDEYAKCYELREISDEEASFISALFGDEFGQFRFL